MQLSSDDVAQIVREVWSAMLGLDAELVVSPPPFTEPAIAGSVGVSGASDCLICLEMSAEGARLFGANMFGMDVGEISVDDITDAVGELTNMIGGNLKSLLPEPSSLSLPIVAHGRNPTLKVVGGKELVHAQFASEGHPIVVTAWSRPQAG
jgi:chemotaxis protein CheX